MRPDPSDIAARRMRNTRPRYSSSAQPLKPGSGKKLTLVILALLMIASLILVIQNRDGIGQYINRPISKVKMDKQWQQVTEQEIAQMIAGYMGTGFFYFDVIGAKEILEQHAWIKEASIKKIWPDSLLLRITEQVAIALWDEDKLLTQYGEIIQPENARELNGLPILSGPIDSQIEVMEQFQLMSKLLFSSGLRLSGLTLSQRGSWNLTLNDSMQVAVGREQVSERLQRFIEFYEGQPAAQTAVFSSVDLRYNNGIAVESSHEERAEVAVR